MGEFEDMLNSILSSPGQMEKIMGLARELSGESAPAPEPEPERRAEPRSEPRPEPRSEARSSPIPGLGDISPKTLAALGRLLGELRSKDDGKAALVASMKPYLRPERREALDRAVKLARIARVAKIAMSEFGGDLDLGI